MSVEKPIQAEERTLLVLVYPASILLVDMLPGVVMESHPSSMWFEQAELVPSATTVGRDPVTKHSCPIPRPQNLVHKWTSIPGLVFYLLGKRSPFLWVLQGVS